MPICRERWKTRELRAVRDNVEACPVDLTLRFEPKALGLTDLDGDDVDELTFAYWLSCRGDVSPDSLKLLIMEGDDKYIIRGQGHFSEGCGDGVDEDELGCKDVKQVDASFENRPPQFLGHALEVWERISPQNI